jgi:antitoxin component YwqK of YwqJK toxin-antitoxin module
MTMIAVYKKFFLMLGVTVLLCLSASVVWSETMDDLVKRDGLYYKKFNNVPFTGTIDGKIQGSFKNGKRNGSWIIYWDNGQLRSKGDYKNGMYDGSWIKYGDNGQLRSKGHYKNGMYDGSWIKYGDDGQLWSKGNFRNGKHEGSWVFYKYDGSLDKVNSGTYKDGKRISD